MTSKVSPYLIVNYANRQALIERPHSLQEAIKRTREVFPELPNAELGLSFLTDDLELCKSSQVEIGPSTWKLLSEDSSFMRVVIQKNAVQNSVEAIKPTVSELGTVVQNSTKPTHHPETTLTLGAHEVDRQQPGFCKDCGVPVDNLKPVYVPLDPSVTTSLHIQICIDSSRVAVSPVSGFRSQTVNYIISRIQDQTGIPVSRLQLHCADHKLHGLATLQSYGLEAGSTLYLKITSTYLPVHPDPGHMRVFVKTLTGKTFTFMVSAVDTVEYLKSRIQDEQGTPHDQCRLYVSGKQMMDEQSLAFYQIHEDTTMILILSKPTRA